MSALAKALLEFQSDAPALQRDALNPHFKSKFISLENLMGHVMPVANKHGLVITQLPTVLDGLPALRTRIIHAESGEEIEDVMLLQAEREGPQAQGSALTYARRYALMAALGLVADDDDDGNAANGSGADRTGGTAPEDPDAARHAYLEAVERATRPSDLPISFGKNKGTPLGSLKPVQLRWYAEEWEPQEPANDYDRKLKRAAQSLHAGNDTFDDAIDDLPFA